LALVDSLRESFSFFAEIIGKAEDKYNPREGWDSTAQPFEGLSREEYREIAEGALPVLQNKMTALCEAQHLSYIEIDHKDYQAYENSAEPFRDWFNKYCHARGLSPNADIALVACVKDENSSEFKEKTRSPDRVRDYVRAMAIVLEGSKRKQTEQSIERMGDLIATFDNDVLNGTLARKNYFHTPKDNGYRAYKALWRIEAQGELEGYPILAEVKIEHESQQDLNRMTRKFMGITRSMRDSIETFYDKCGSSGQNRPKIGHNSGVRPCNTVVDDAKTMNSNFVRLSGVIKDIDKYSLGAYDSEHEKAGLDCFLGKNLNRKRVTPDEMQTAIINAALHFPGIPREIEKAGLRYSGRLPMAADKYELATGK